MQYLHAINRETSGIRACLALFLGLAGLGCSTAPSAGNHAHHHDGPTVHHRFEDARKWASIFEDTRRDEWQTPDRVLELMDLTPDSRVADVGSATGYFPVRIARRVPAGVVYGVDIEPTLVNYLNLRARSEAIDNLVSLVCKPDDPCLPEPVDVILVCNTYHHLGDRVSYFSRVKNALRPRGRVLVVDFKLGDFPVGPKDSHKLPAEKVIREMTEAGYRLVAREDLKYQYVLVFTLLKE